MDAYARTFSAAPVPEGWALVEGQPPHFEFAKGDAGFVCTIDWFDTLSPDTVYRFATVPGRADGF